MDLSLFKAITESKINHSFHFLPFFKREAIKSIPLLFHYGISSLALGLHEESPHGIFDYSPEQDVIDEFNRFWGLHISNKTHRQDVICIESLLAMGSFGTIAFKEGSDIDYWLIVRDNTDRPALQKKCTVIENVYKTRFELEIHFFIMTRDEIYHNKFGSVDNESAGSSLAVLLKDEFYRTATFFAGKIPAWFINGPELNLLQDQLIDLGSLNDFSTDEIYGAAIWQILKGTSSPMKSIVKLSLIQYLLSNKTTLSFPAVEIKTRSETVNAYVDPYLYLYKNILRYYHELSSKNVPPISSLEDLMMDDTIKTLTKYKHHYLTCIAVYLSINKQYRTKELIKEIFDPMPFSQAFIKKLDDFTSWTINDYLILNKQAISFIFMIYQTIRENLQTFKKQISDEDLTIISRKLASNLLKKPRKIMSYSILPVQPNEKIFIINELKKGYNLYKNTVLENNLLFSTESIVAVAGWMIKNNFEIQHIQLRINSPTGRLNKKTFEFIYEKIQRFLLSLPHSRSEAFLTSPVIVSLFVFVNFFNNEGNVLHDAQALVVNSWGELIELSDYQNPVKMLLEQIMPDLCDTSDITICFLDSYHEKPEITHNINVMLEPIRMLFGSSDKLAVWLTEYKGVLYLFVLKNKKLTVSKYASVGEVISELGSFEKAISKTISVDKSNPALALVYCIYGNTPNGEVCIYLTESAGSGVLFLIDENRSLVSKTYRKDQEIYEMYRYLHFLTDHCGKKIKLFKIIKQQTVQASDMTEQYAILLRSAPRKYVPIETTIKENGYSFMLPKTVIDTDLTDLSLLSRQLSPNDPPFFSKIISERPLSTAEAFSIMIDLENKIKL